MTGVQTCALPICALSGGQAFEALNNAGNMDANLLVILNDNDMSISENVGALSKYLARVLAGRFYAHLREGGKRVLRRMPHIREFARRSEEHVKGMWLPGTVFEEIGNPDEWTVRSDEAESPAPDAVLEACRGWTVLDEGP